MVEYFFRHAFWQIHCAELIVNIDVANIFAIDACFVGQRTDNVARFNLMRLTRLYAIGNHFQTVFTVVSGGLFFTPWWYFRPG